MMPKTIVAATAALLVAACGGGGTSSADSTTCANFATQSQAQQYFNTHDAPQLDADHDGIACEALPA
jgi:ABC-type glycerol-3-phosphate transport system substrate-binding protein